MSTKREDVERLAHHAGKLLLGTTLERPVMDTLHALLAERDVAADFGLPLTTLGNWHAEWKLARKDQSA